MHKHSPFLYKLKNCRMVLWHCESDCVRFAFCETFAEKRFDCEFFRKIYCNFSVRGTVHRYKTAADINYAVLIVVAMNAEVNKRFTQFIRGENIFFGGRSYVRNA
jgi:hypothetical protein